MVEAELLHGHGNSTPTSDSFNPKQDLRPILQTILRTNENLAAQNKALIHLLASGNTSAQWEPGVHGGITPTHYHGRSGSLAGSHVDYVKAPETNAQIWEGILRISATQSEEFMQAYYFWSRPTRIDEVLYEKSRWTSWSYAAAFPALSRFLKQTTTSPRTNCQVWMDDFNGLSQEPRSISYTEGKRNLHLLWEEIKCRDALSSFHKEIGIKDACSLSVRVFRIADISPLVLTAIFGSISQSDLSYVAAFVERYLNFSNWGKASLLKFGDLSWSSYTFEYHFSFYYVTSEYSEAGSMRIDPRKCRKSAPFGREMATKTRYIHEETLSFLLVGHFRDVTTCFQFAESYFKFDPYKKNTHSGSFRPYNLRQPPSLLLLSWIAVALHHVLWRWQSAIEAVESEIKSASQIVFLDDRSDLMADDPQFSLSKTYFWALQAYKLFEQTLLDTVNAWKKFKMDSLSRLRDPRVASEEWKISIQDIDDAVEELEAKVARVRKRINEVKDLRTGLISASALFDSRTAVRQGENIRLLTYITILFLPLSFATSIFGMQILGSSQTALNAFAISLPMITIGTALLMFNLEHMLNWWNSLTGFCSTWLRRHMRQHRRSDWKDRAIALHEDIVLSQAPVRKAQRQSSGWVYLLFLLEFMLVALPLGEIGAVMNAVGLLEKSDGAATGAPTQERRASLSVENGVDIDPALSKQEQMKARIRERIEQSLEDEKRREKQRKREKQGQLIVTLSKSWKSTWKATKKVLKVPFDILRAVLLPVWMMLLLVEHIILATALGFQPLFSSSGNPHSTHPPRKPVWIRAWEILGLAALLPLDRKAPNNRPDEFEIQAVTRVATKLGGMNSPRTNTSTTMGSLNHKTSSAQVINPESKVAQKASLPSINHSSRAQHAEDILRVSTPAVEVTSAGCARKPPRGSVDSQMELDYMQEESFGGQGRGLA